MGIHSATPRPGQAEGISPIFFNIPSQLMTKANPTRFKRHGKLEPCNSDYIEKLESLSLEQIYNTHQSLMETFVELVKYEVELRREDESDFFKSDPYGLVGAITQTFTVDQMASEVYVQVSSLLDQLYMELEEKRKKPKVKPKQDKEE